MSETAASSRPSPFVARGRADRRVRRRDPRRLAEAEVPPLLPALAYLTGDLSLLRAHLRPDPILLACPRAGSPRRSSPRPASSRSRRSIRVPRRRLRARAAALARPSSCRSWSSRSGAAPTWPRTSRSSKRSSPSAARTGARRAGARPTIAPDADFRVVDHRRGHVGPARRPPARARPASPFVIFEKNDDVGGTWLENSYPGCRVDNPNHNYSYSFAQRHDWPFHFSTQDVLLDYFRRCADVFGLREHVRFGTTVRSATWSEADRRWTV